MTDGGSVVQIGASNPTTNFYTQGKNNTGATIPAGSVVYINGASGGFPSFALAQANSSATSDITFGVAMNAIANGSNGTVITAGILSNVNTSAWTVGTLLWLSPTTAGGLTSTMPSAPNHSVFIGFVTTQSSGSGQISVNIQNGYQLEELHNVAISSPANQDLLSYNSSTNLWNNVTISSLGLATQSYVTGLGYLTISSASSTYLTQSSASSTYLTQSSASSTYAPKASPTFTGTVTIPAGASISGYLTTASASSTYLTISNASSTYLSNTNANSYFLQKTDAASLYLTISSASATYYPSTNPSGYLSDAPSDSYTYGRYQGTWTSLFYGLSFNILGTTVTLDYTGITFPDGSLQTTAASAGLSDAPYDGNIYGRQNGSWVYVPSGGGLSDAPSDGTTYGRQNGAWTNLYYGTVFNVYGYSTQMNASGFYFPDGSLQTTAASGGSYSALQATTDAIAGCFAVNSYTNNYVLTGFAGSSCLYGGKFQSGSSYQIGIGSAYPTTFSGGNDSNGYAIGTAYASSSPSGMYLYYSQDGGSTWTQSSFPIS